MNEKHKEFMKARRAIKYAYGRATCSVNGVILIYRGIPVGELGWKYWAYKIVRYMQTGGTLYGGGMKLLAEEITNGL